MGYKAQVTTKGQSHLPGCFRSKLVTPHGSPSDDYSVRPCFADSPAGQGKCDEQNYIQTFLCTIQTTTLETKQELQTPLVWCKTAIGKITGTCGVGPSMQANTKGKNLQNGMPGGLRRTPWFSPSFFRLLHQLFKQKDTFSDRKETFSDFYIN